MAIEVEHRLRINRQQKHEKTEIDIASDIDETLVKDATAIECSVSNNDTSAAVDSLLDDNVTTLNENVVNEIEEAFEKMSTVSEEILTNTNLDIAKPSDIAKPLSLTIDPNFSTYNEDILSPCFSLHSSPSLGALDESRNQSLYFTPMSGRECYSPAPSGQYPTARLIRSNSYTIEKPSAMLLKHMEANGISIGSVSSPFKSPMMLNELRKNRSVNNSPRQLFGDSLQVNEQKSLIGVTKTAKSKFPNNSLNSTVVPSNQNSAKSSSSYVTKSTKPQILRSNQTSSGGMFKQRETWRSIYEPKPTKAKESAKKVNGSAASMDSNRSISSPRPSIGNESISSVSSNGKINAKTYQDIFAMIEQKHEAQMKAMLQRQQEEQKRMQQEFLRQQEELLRKISVLVKNKEEKTVTPNGMTDKLNGTNQKVDEESKKSNEKMLIEEVNNDVTVTVDTNGNRINRFTPESSKCIRRLYYDDNKLVANELNKSYPSSLSTISSEPYEMYLDEEVKAATIITAYVRGYLTRRLFKTTKVGNIVKTIRDTLLFLLDMHYERNENESAADIELKSHLIQQVILTE